MKLIITQSNLTLKGGGERVLLKIAQHYKAKIYTAEYNPKTTFEEFSDLDVNVVGKSALAKFLPYGRVVQGLNYGLSFYGLKLKDDYDVINPHFAPSHWIRNSNERVLWYCHTPLRDVWDLYTFRMQFKKVYQKPVHAIGARVIRLIDRSIVKDIEAILANSANTRSRLIKYFGRSDARVLSGGIDYETYPNNGDGHYFFYPSRISPNKQQHAAIEAFQRFKRMHKGKRYKLVIVGPVSKDKYFYSYYEQIKAQAARVGDVQIHTDVDEKWQRELFSRCTAVLYPPVNEDYGIVPLEGMAARKPVIALNEGGPRETLVNGKTGFLVNSAEHMAERMLYVVEHPSVAEIMGKAGLARVKAHYTWPRFFDVFDKELRKVAKMR